MTNTFDWHREAEKAWDERASYWSQNSQNMWDHGSRKTIIPFVQQYVQKGNKVADIGCGDGYGSYKLFKAGYEVVGVDISKEMIERANQRTGDEKLSFVQGDLVELPFAADTFDGVMAVNSLEWIEIPVQALHELKRVIKHDGHLCAGILGPTAKPRINSYPRLYGEPAVCNTMMPWEFQQLAEETGWELIDGHGIYKREVRNQHYQDLPTELKQSLTFMWVFMLRNKKQ